MLANLVLRVKLTIMHLAGRNLRHLPQVVAKCHKLGQFATTCVTLPQFAADGCKLRQMPQIAVNDTYTLP